MASWFRARVVALSLVVSALAAAPSSAAVILLDSPFVAKDGITWSRFGGNLTSLVSPTATTTDKGIAVTVGGPSALTLFDGGTYNSDFLATDTVVSAFDVNTFDYLSGPIRLTFGAGQSKVGARIQALSFGDFTARITAYGLGDVELGSFTLAGTNGFNGDGTAAFIGVGSDADDIYRVDFAIEGDSTGMAIGDVSLVPEPTTLALTVLGAAALLRRRRLA